MKAAIITEYGRTDVLHVADIEMPTLADDQILVQVKAASINPRDWLLMRGLYPFRSLAKPFPITLGSDMSGTIVKVGTSVTGFKQGDDVFGMQPIGGKFGAFAEYISIKATAVALKPAEISHRQAAAMPCAGMTSFQAIRDLAKLKPEQTILINGASGGVGSYAIQFAKAVKAKVVAVCGPTNASLCLDLGADETINYKEENFENRQDAFDVVYDVIGRSSLSKSSAALKKDGCYISTIPAPKVAASVALSKLTVLNPLGKRLKGHMILVKPDGRDLATMANMMKNGTVRSLIDSDYALENISEAFEKSQSWRTRGKLLITMPTSSL